MTATWYIFTILSMLRQNIPPSQIPAHLQKMGLKLTPRLPVWLALCHSCGLLNQQNHPTALFHQWLAWPAADQTLRLLAAWQTSPRGRKNRQWRQRLLRRLQCGQPLLAADMRQLPVLQALGLCQDSNLSPWGQVILGFRPAPTPLLYTQWQFNNDLLQINHPVDWPLLWQLESCLRPCAPLTYRLDPVSLRCARQRNDPQTLLNILEKGLGAPPPPALRAQILGQPSLQTTPGLVLEFSDPAELRQLRRSEPLRSHFQRLLSPRHVLVDEKSAPRLLQLLERRGIYANTPPPNRTVSSSDLGEGIGEGVAPVLSRVEARTHFPRADLLQPLGPSLPLLDFIQQSIRQQTAFDLLYHAPGGERPETHRITPVLIEERGGYTYIIAYSHNRHGQRTYRLDRMEVPGTTRA
jgi:hypothetical protein